MCTLTLSAGVRDESNHFLTTELGVGYSSLFHNSDIASSPGLAGGLFQVGYEWQYRSFLLHTGLEFSSINGMSKVYDFSLSTDYTQGLPSGVSMIEHFNFYDYREKQFMGQLNLPIMFGGLFQNRYFFLAGAKIGLPVYSLGKTTTSVRTTLTDPTLIGALGDDWDVPNHDVLTTAEQLSSKWSSSAVNFQMSAEVGLQLNSFFAKNNKKNVTATKGAQKNVKPQILYRVSLFADCGVMACNNPIDGVLATVAEPRDIVINSFVDNTSTKVNSLLVGAKFAVLFQLNKPKSKSQKTIPSWIDINVEDDVTGTAIPARLEIKGDYMKKAQVKNTNKNGYLRYKALRVSNYTITASSNNYYPSSGSVSIVEEGSNEQISFALHAIPWLRLNVTNAETNEPLKADAHILKMGTQDTIMKFSTDENGYAKIQLAEGQTYSMSVDKSGFMSFSTNITNVGDSINISLEPIKQGVKVVLHNVFFATNQTQLLPESMPALEDLYTFLKDNEDVRIRIVGHTDNTGSDSFNQRLSEGRAESVKKAVVERGISADRIETEGKGKSEPVASNDTEEGRAQNRRVEFIIL